MLVRQRCRSCILALAADCNSHTRLQAPKPTTLRSGTRHGAPISRLTLQPHLPHSEGDQQQP
jgi:hypothetical protein